MDSFAIYTDTLKNRRSRKKAATVADTMYEQMIDMLRSYVMSSETSEKAVHIYDSYKSGYTIFNDSYTNLTAKCMANYLSENEDNMNKDDFLFNSLIDIVPEKIVLHCSINSKLFITVKKVFNNVFYE